MKISLSEIDKDRFGVVIAKSLMDEDTEVGSVLDWCGEKHVEMIILRCSTTAIRTVQELEEAGFRMMDTLVYFGNAALEQHDVKLEDGYLIRQASEQDRDAVELVAHKSFSGFFGHYHADSQLDRSSADKVYSSWAANSCAGNSDIVFVAVHQGVVVAFLTARRSGGELEILLNGVDPLHQKKGLYGALLATTINWSISASIKHIIVSTQVNNIAPQKTWCRHGFEPINSFYTFHKWFDK